MHATTLSFRAGNDFADEVRTLAGLVGLKSSDYIRQAVLEKNEQVMAQRIAALSKELSAEHLAFNESLDKDYFPLRVALVNQSGLAQATDLLIDQIRAISNRRLMGTKPLATLSVNHLKRVEDALRLLIGR